MAAVSMPVLCHTGSGMPPKYASHDGLHTGAIIFIACSSLSLISSLFTIQ